MLRDHEIIMEKAKHILESFEDSEIRYTDARAKLGALLEESANKKHEFTFQDLIKMGALEKYYES